MGAMGRCGETPNGAGGLGRGEWEAAADAEGSGKGGEAIGAIGTPR